MVESRHVGINRRVRGSSQGIGIGLDFSPMFWVYVLQNSAGKFYIGHTDDLGARLDSHNRTDRVLGKFTRKNGPWHVVWSEEHPTRAAAMGRERQIKRMKSLLPESKGQIQSNPFNKAATETPCHPVGCTVSSLATVF